MSKLLYCRKGDHFPDDLVLYKRNGRTTDISCDGIGEVSKIYDEAYDDGSNLGLDKGSHYSDSVYDLRPKCEEHSCYCVPTDPNPEASRVEKAVRDAYSKALNLGPFPAGESSLCDMFVEEIVYCGGPSPEGYDDLESSVYRATTLRDDLNHIISALESLELKEATHDQP